MAIVGPSWLTVLSLFVQLAGIFYLFRGPRRAVTFDVNKREIQIKPEGIFSETNGRNIPFDQVRELVVSEKSRELIAQTNEGVVYLLSVNRTYANEQAVNELRTIFGNGQHRPA